MREVKRYHIKEYINEKGLSPYRKWLNTLDMSIKARVQARILRLETGSLGDYKPLGDGIYELKLDFGKGYRVYFGFDGFNIVILLIGGDKSSQSKDISKAKEFWQVYKEHP